MGAMSENLEQSQTCFGGTFASAVMNGVAELLGGYQFSSSSSSLSSMSSSSSSTSSGSSQSSTSSISELTSPSTSSESSVSSTSSVSEIIYDLAVAFWPETHFIGDAWHTNSLVIGPYPYAFNLVADGTVTVDDVLVINGTVVQPDIPNHTDTFPDGTVLGTFAAGETCTITVFSDMPFSINANGLVKVVMI